MRIARTAAAALAATALAGTSAGAQFTYNSPTGQALPSSVSAVGGLVVDLIGTNGNRVVAQRAASGLFVGNTPNTPTFTIGVQTGFTNAILSQLGGGLTAAAFRVSLFDGDSRAGNFDFNDNFLQVNGNRVGNFSAVSTVETNGTGVLVGTGNIANGFGNNILNTGFFFTTDATALASIFAGMLSTGELTYTYEDLDPADQFLDFTQGIDRGLIDVGAGPVVTPGPGTVIPEPSTYALVAAGLAGVAAGARRRTRLA